MGMTLLPDLDCIKIQWLSWLAERPPEITSALLETCSYASNPTHLAQRATFRGLSWLLKISSQL